MRQYEKANSAERKENVVANLQDELSNLKAIAGVGAEIEADAADSGTKSADTATAPDSEPTDADDGGKGTGCDAHVPRVVIALRT